ncbi:hypothetical protein TorRG33x02_356610 [Trema orientale]|uniref:Uncharacterized protein n=1 Tax=Trema orientale TaxID=63057 RepID=A0A2P5A6U4_TREOI|nr:hypothetical protein TorRG33x02_356610 [Trema orientale]
MEALLEFHLQPQCLCDPNTPAHGKTFSWVNFAKRVIRTLLRATELLYPQVKVHTVDKSLCVASFLRFTSLRNNNINT